MKKRNKKANAYIIVGVIILFGLFIGGFLFISNLKIIEADSGVQEKEIIICELDSDCEDNNACTINSCAGETCIISEVLLCYNSDGCCPENCNSANDDDCLGKE